jgi:hypothetical protein
MAWEEMRNKYEGKIKGPKERRKYMKTEKTNATGN